MLLTGTDARSGIYERSTSDTETVWSLPADVMYLLGMSYPNPECQPALTVDTQLYFRAVR